MTYSLTTIPPNRPRTPKHVARRSRMQQRGYRYYNPGLGRWVNRDPIGGVHLYLVCRNATVYLIDPFGLAEIHNESGMKLVIIGSEWFRYKTMKDCKCSPGNPEEEEIPAIPLVLDKNEVALEGDPIEDPDAAIDLDGAPYKVGKYRNVNVTGGPPPAALSFTLGPDLRAYLPGDYGKKPTVDFWKPAGMTIVQRCDAAVTQLTKERNYMLICGLENKTTIDRVDALIAKVKDAKEVLQTVYNLSSPSPSP